MKFLEEKINSYNINIIKLIYNNNNFIKYIILAIASGLSDYFDFPSCIIKIIFKSVTSKINIKITEEDVESVASENLSALEENQSNGITTQNDINPLSGNEVNSYKNI
jgi:hypothetical protein